MPTRRWFDPVGNYNFRMEIDGIAVAAFSGVEGLSVEQEMVEWRVGDEPIGRKRPGMIKYSDITLKGFYMADQLLWDWFDKARIGWGDTDNTRKSISIILCDNSDPSNSDSEVTRWNCYECYPKSWKLGGFDGKGNDALVEELVLSIEWWEVE